MKILCFDPSGNKSKRDGNGTTGWAAFHGNKLIDFGDIKASDHKTIEQYWYEHLIYIRELGVDTVVCESYKLQPTKAMQQSWSNLETPQLIGFIRMYCYQAGIKFIFQDPKDKARMNDDILEHLGVVTKKGKNYYIGDRLTNLHMRDSIRHGLYYLKYGVKK